MIRFECGRRAERACGGRGRRRWGHGEWRRAGIALIALALLSLPSCSDDSAEGGVSSKDKEQRRLAITSGDWPIFRGDPGMAGSIETALPDRLSLSWRFETGGEIKSSPVVYRNVVYIGSGDGRVYAIDAASGTSIWTEDVGSPVEAPPLYHDYSLYVGTVDGALYSLDASDGAVRWTYETDGRIAGSANVFTRDVPGNDGRIGLLVGSYDNKLHAVDADSGVQLWTYESGYFINGSAAIAGENAIFGGCDAILHVVSLSDGTGVAEVDTGAYIAGSPAFRDGIAFIANYANKLLAVDLESASILWEYENDDPAGAFYSSPATDGELVVVGGRDGRLFCVEAGSGEVLWTFTAAAEIDSSPVIAGNRVVTASMDGYLYVLDLATGAKLWSYETGAEMVASPAVAAGVIVVGGVDGVVYAFGGSK